MSSPRSLRLASAAALAAAMPLVGVAVVPASVLPAAVADDTSQCRAVSAADMAWGIRQSLRNYLTGPIAAGGWDLDGITYTGATENAEDGAFHFTADPRGSRVEGDAADLPMGGTMHLTGHGGIINVTLSNFELQIRGNRGQLLADGRYLAADPAAVASLVGGPPAFTQQPVATFTFDRTLTQAGAASGSAVLTGASWIHENLNKGLLGSYGEGKNEGDPVVVTVKTSGPGDCGVDRNAVMASSAGQTDTVESPAASASGTAAAAQAGTPAAQALSPVTGAAAGGTPTGTGSCTVADASVGWGLKKSFRSYLTGPIAMGRWDLDQVGFSGSEGGDDGQFRFTADPSAVKLSGGDADIPLKGSVHLTGHFGALDITYSNMVVKVRGTTAQFIADYRSNTVSSYTAGAQVTGAKTGTQVPIAQFELTSPISAAGGSVKVSGPGYITEDGNQSLGGNYGEGNNQADPIDITLDTSGAGCATGAGSQGLGGITSAGAASSGGSAASAGVAAAGTPDLSVTPRVSGITSAGSTGSAGTSDTTCQASDGDRNVVETRMGWGIKDSFRSYIKGSIAKGDWTTGGGAVYSDGNFVFSGSEGTLKVSAGSVTSGTLKFGGSVTFTGHEGVLHTVVSDPEIRLNGGTGTLVANVSSNDTSGNPHDYGRISLADLSLSGVSLEGGILDGSASASLSADGSTALAGYYSAGEALDPVSFRAAVSDSCDTTSAASLGDKPADESDGDADKDDKAAKERKQGKVTVNGAEATDGENSDTGLVAFLKDPRSMVPSVIAVIAAAVAGAMAVRLRRTNRRIDEIAAATGTGVVSGGGEPGEDD